MPGVATRRLLLLRQHRVHVRPGSSGSGARATDGLALELADLGYVASSRLAERLRGCAPEDVATIRSWLCPTLARHLGADRRHVPLFRKFPEDVPIDTTLLLFQKLLVHYVQAEGRACLTCGEVGTTHVLDPCRHVVCDRCFDGANYSACPVCEHHVGPSPFFLETAPRGTPREEVTFRRLELGEDLDADAEALFRALVGRSQPLTPDDLSALATLLDELGARVLEWLPPKLVVRENVALVFGRLFASLDAEAVLARARPHLGSATDVLRLVAALSGADVSLAPTARWVQTKTGGVWSRSCRFPVRKLGRALRRALLALLEAQAVTRGPDSLVEDMLRHRSHWVWLGEHLHPTEYAARFPHVAAAFAVVRRRAPDGTRAERPSTFASAVEAARRAGDVPAMLGRLVERPGELVRRLDLLLRLSTGATRDAVSEAFASRVGACATPTLVLLRAHFATRGAPWPVRVHFPKAAVGVGFSTPDRRPPLDAATRATTLRTVERELLRRFAARPPVDSVVLDEALRRVSVPFATRTASPAAVALPRGSRIGVPEGGRLRFFLHWCEPARHGRTTDLDLSVGFYDASFAHTGVCSFYELTASGPAGVYAQSAGDLRSAPFPDGATELVDVDLAAARAAGARYAVMVVNAWSGMGFGELERAFAGLMVRDDPGGAHFDPRTVRLRFGLGGAHGVFAPLVVDLEQRWLHWLDVYAPGALAWNSVHSSNRALSRLCPSLMAYFAHGVRPSVFDLGALHAAARAPRVYLRGEGDMRRFDRATGESPEAFLERILGGGADGSGPPPSDGPPALALLEHGDLALPGGSAVYALFPALVASTFAPADLL